MSMKTSCYSIVFLIVSVGYVNAAEFSVEASPTASGVAYAISFDGMGAGNFNVFAVRLYPNSPAVFLNAGAGDISDSPGMDKTFINPVLDGPLETGGWFMPFKLTTPEEVAFDAGILGAYVDTTQPLFLSNVVLPAGATGTANIKLLDTGIEVFAQTIRLGVPEPTSLAMASLGLVGLVLRRRNG